MVSRGDVNGPSRHMKGLSGVIHGPRGLMNITMVEVNELLGSHEKRPNAPCRTKPMKITTLTAPECVSNAIAVSVNAFAVSSNAIGVAVNG